MNNALGRKGKDKITGFKGTITGFCEYVTGCNQYLLAAKSKDSNVQGEACWFDTSRVSVSGKAVKLLSDHPDGPDMAAPIR